jgi:hypothetical protein
VPDFALNEMQEMSVGTHDHNRECIKQVVAAIQPEQGMLFRKDSLCVLTRHGDVLV